MNENNKKIELLEKLNVEDRHRYGYGIRFEVEKVIGLLEYDNMSYDELKRYIHHMLGTMIYDIQKLQHEIADGKWKGL